MQMTFHNPGAFHSSDNPDHLMVFAQIDNPQPYSNLMNSDPWEERTTGNPYLGSASTTLGCATPDSPNA